MRERNSWDSLSPLIRSVKWSSRHFLVGGRTNLNRFVYLCLRQWLFFASAVRFTRHLTCCNKTSSTGCSSPVSSLAFRALTSPFVVLMFQRLPHLKNEPIQCRWWVWLKFLASLSAQQCKQPSHHLELKVFSSWTLSSSTCTLPVDGATFCSASSTFYCSYLVSSRIDALQQENKWFYRENQLKRRRGNIQSPTMPLPSLWYYRSSLLSLILCC